MTPSGTVGRDERLRLFLGFRLPESAAVAVERWQSDELPEHDVRPVVPGEPARHDRVPRLETR